MFRKSSQPWFIAVLLSLALATLASSCNSGKSGPTGPGTGLELDSGDFGPGAVYQHRFASAGTFAYHCIHHAPMTGVVQVSASATDSLVGVSIVSSTSAFPGVLIKPGGVVTWTNNTGAVHTVTSN